jgi:hypothetical protein
MRRPPPFRPHPLAPIPVGGDYWVVTLHAEACLLLLIRSGRAARLCNRADALAGHPRRSWTNAIVAATTAA